MMELNNENSKKYAKKRNERIRYYWNYRINKRRNRKINIKSRIKNVRDRINISRILPHGKIIYHNGSIFYENEKNVTSCQLFSFVI